MKQTKDNIEIVARIFELSKEWISLVDSAGNECAYTDSILEQIQKNASKLDE